MPNESREARWSVNGAGSAATERECKTERVAALKKNSALKEEYVHRTDLG